jgi:hypothetical protein
MTDARSPGGFAMIRFRPIKIVVATILLTVSMTIKATAQDQANRNSVEDLLHQGKLAAARQQLDSALNQNPDDDNNRFALGVVEFLRAVEGRMQAFYRYGCRTAPDGMLSFSNLPIPPNPKPDPLDYKTARAVLQAWVDDLGKVEATLAKV